MELNVLANHVWNVSDNFPVKEQINSFVIIMRVSQKVSLRGIQFEVSYCN
jgi:hypothetical protein